MKIREVMTRGVEVVPPEATLQEAARTMRDIAVGVVPVCDGQQLLGMVTDRDITVRAIAEGRDPKTTPVREVMTQDVSYCYEDDDVAAAALAMEEQQIRRLPIVDRDRNLVGIISLGDLAVDTEDDDQSGEVLREVSKPAEPER